jgi:hypothetical protein
MKLLILLLGACSSDICTMDIGSADVTADKKLALSGSLDEANPIVILTSAGGQTTTIQCVTTSATAATCDTSSLTPGTYGVMYDFTCKDSGAKKDALALADSVPTSVDLP